MLGPKLPSSLTLGRLPAGSWVRDVDLRSDFPRCARKQSKADGYATVSWNVADAHLCLEWTDPRFRPGQATLIERSARSDGGDARVLVDAQDLTKLACRFPAICHRPFERLIGVWQVANNIEA